MLNESKFSLPWVRCALVVRPNFFETAIETLYETKSFQSVAAISLENNVSPARTLRVIDCTLTFYLEVCEIPRVIFETITGTFLRPNNWRPIVRLF